MIYFNGEKIDIKKFPNGEAMIHSDNLNIRSDKNEIKVKFENDEDITHLIFIKGYLDEFRIKCSLVLPYMPYSRMDRTEGVTVVTLKYLSKLINSLNFEQVVIYEPHSDVSTALLDRVKVVNMSKILTEKLLEELKNQDIYLVYPDAGAAKRYAHQIDYEKVLTANKERDFKTGFINKLEINGEIKSEKFKAIIVDDLCSRGGTFELTAAKLKKMGADEIYLVVTHCENTIFEGKILNSDLISGIYTTNSILTREHEKIKMYEV